MKSLWLDIGNTRLKYWITENQQIIEHAAELHLQSPADLLLGLINTLNIKACIVLGFLRFSIPKIISVFSRF